MRIKSINQLKKGQVLGSVAPFKHSRDGGIATVKGFYGDGSLAIQIIDRIDHSPIATATVCLAPDGPSEHHQHVWLKGWSENEGLPYALNESYICILTGETYEVANGCIAQRALLILPTS